MIIAFACDHAGFPFREPILKYLEKLGHKVIDLGPSSMDPLDDFPDYAKPLCENMIAGTSERGVLVCGTGIGMSIAANKFQNIRAVVCYNPEIAKIGRSHNNSNIACFGGRAMQIEDVLESLDVFLQTEFLGGKYQRRNEKMDITC